MVSILFQVGNHDYTCRLIYPCHWCGIFWCLVPISCNLQVPFRYWQHGTVELIFKYSTDTKSWYRLNDFTPNWDSFTVLCEVNSLQKFSMAIHSWLLCNLVCFVDDIFCDIANNKMSQSEDVNWLVQNRISPIIWHVINVGYNILTETEK